MPKVGQIEDGYKFLGGDPKKESSWTKDVPTPDLGKSADKLLGTARAGLEGMTFGFADEIGLGLAATAASLTEGGSIPDIYKKMKAQYKKEQSQFAEENPLLNIGATMAGGLTTGSAFGGIKAAQEAKALKSLVPIAKHGVKVGAISGAGFSPTMGDIPQDVAMGGLLGGAMPYGLQGAMKTGKGLLGAGKSTAGLPGKLFQSADDATTRTAGKQVLRAYQGDEIPIQSAFAEMGPLGPEAILADVGGANVGKLLQNVASLPGRTAQAAEKTLQGRMAKSVPRVLTALQKTMGTKGTAFRTTKDLITKRSGEAGPLYKAAESQFVDPDGIGALVSNLDDIVTSAKGTKLGAQLKGVQNSLVQKTGLPKTSMKQLHFAKMDIDDRIGVAMRTGNKTLASQLMNVKKNLLEVMDSVPEYAQARQIYSDDSSIISSIERGKKLFRIEPEEMADELQNMSKADRDGFLIGAREAIASVIKKTPEGANSARKVATYAVREQLANAFPDEAGLNQFMKALDIEDTFAQLRNVAIAGSPTQPRVSSEALLAGSAMSDAAQGRFISVVMGKVAQFINNYKHIPAPVRDKIGEMLLSDMSKMDKVSRKTLEKLAKHSIRQEQINDLIYSINAIVTPGITVGATSEVIN